MIQPRLNRRYRFDRQQDGDVALTDGLTTKLFPHGGIAGALLAHVDGVQTVEQIAKRVASQATVLEVVYGLDQLSALGFVCEQAEVHPSEQCVTFTDDNFTSMAAAAVPVQGTYGLGKGIGAPAARCSAHAESLEVEFGLRIKSIPTLRASRRELGTAAVHPNEIQLFGPGEGPHFDDSAETDWLEVSGANGSRFIDVTTAEPTGFDFNGMAASDDYPNAVQHGILELIERDALAIWWYNRLVRDGVAWGEIGDAYLDEVDEFVRSRRRHWWILDLTSDLDIPVFAAISFAPLAMGFGAAVNPAEALRSAAAELVQMMLLREHSDQLWDSAEWLGWWADRRPEVDGYLRPGRIVSVRDAPDHVPTQMLEDVGLDPLVLNCGNSGSTSIVRTFCPGLRPALPRFAPGRLFDSRDDEAAHRSTRRRLNGPLFPEWSATQA